MVERITEAKIECSNDMCAACSLLVVRVGGGGWGVEGWRTYQDYAVNQEQNELKDDSSAIGVRIFSSHSVLGHYAKGA